ncbi:SPW repeat domain-containing protein [Flavobacterium limi]|nr:hypothetical protein [Flavobacterium limi]
MKIIDTKTHGYMDYIMGIFLIACPSLFDLGHETVQGIVFYAAGAAAVVYSILTNYELGLVKIIPMKIHLTLDFLSGVFLATSPWLFGFAETVYGPHLTLGIIEILVSILTSHKITREVEV